MNITVTTGYGYYKDLSGRIVAKAELPIGDHNLDDGLRFFEVDTKDELNAIAVFQEPLTDSQIEEILIEEEKQEVLKNLAIESLQSKSMLRLDYAVTRDIKQ